MGGLLGVPANIRSPCASARIVQVASRGYGIDPNEESQGVGMTTARESVQLCRKTTNCSSASASWVDRFIGLGTSSQFITSSGQRGELLSQ